MLGFRRIHRYWLSSHNEFCSYTDATLMHWSNGRKPITPTFFLQLGIPKLVQDEGSLTKLQILNNGNPNKHYVNYSGVVTYDQGSNLAKVEPSTVPLNLPPLAAFGKSYSAAIEKIYAAFGGSMNFYIFYGTSYVAISLVIKYWHFPRRKRRIFMIKIRDGVLSLHHSLNENPNSDETFDHFMEQWASKVYYGSSGLSLSK